MKNNLLSKAFVTTMALLAFVANTNAQSTEKKQLTRQEASTKNVQSARARTSRPLIQDRMGNIWTCNNRAGEGVTMYDGKNYKQFTEKDGLGCDVVMGVLEDNTGKLWFATADGITLYDGKAFLAIPISQITKATSYKKTKRHPHHGFPEPTSNWVNCIMQDRNGTMWLGTFSGVYRYDGRAFSHFAQNDGAPNKTGVKIGHVENIIQDDAGKVWFGGTMSDGVFCYDGKALTNLKPNGNQWVIPLLQSKSGKIYFSTRGSNGLYEYDGKTFKIILEDLQSGSCSGANVNEDNLGNLWFLNDKKGGVARYDGKTVTNFGVKDGLCEGSAARAFLSDKDSNIWFYCIGSKDSHLFYRRPFGLCRYNGKSFAFIPE